MTDLTTRYLGLELRSPIVASASPLNGQPDTARRGRGRRRGRHRHAVAVRGGDPARGDRSSTGALEAGTEHHAEARGYFPTFDSFASTGDRYLSALERIKARGRASR